ncbi:MAG TPA: hypothetical protein PKW73_06995, partial [Candidatus Obscuribacter sp.]|nr:hypothetical protein [Candidatus Obscuribacter sp.]
GVTTSTPTAVSSRLIEMVSNTFSSCWVLVERMVKGQKGQTVHRVWCCGTVVPPELGLKAGRVLAPQKAQKVKKVLKACGSWR